MPFCALGPPAARLPLSPCVQRLSPEAETYKVLLPDNEIATRTDSSTCSEGMMENDTVADDTTPTQPGSSETNIPTSKPKTKWPLFVVGALGLILVDATGAQLRDLGQVHDLPQV